MSVDPMLHHVARGALAALLFLFASHAGFASPGDPSSQEDPGEGTVRVFLPSVSSLPATIWMPVVANSPYVYECPKTSGNSYMQFRLDEGALDPRPAALHADLNLGMRGYEQVPGFLGMVEYAGDTDRDPPQLAGLFGDYRVPGFASAWQVYDWDWECGPLGCRGPLLEPPGHPEVTLLGMTTTAGEPIYIPRRSRQVHSGGFKAFVLYAEERRITLKYTSSDNVSYGYTVHLENVCVDPNLLAEYTASNAAARMVLPALPEWQPLGTAAADQIYVAIRDCGTFMDPRSHKDWWKNVPYQGPIIYRQGTARGW